MPFFTKSLTAGIAVIAMTSVTPTMAQDRYRDRDRDGGIGIGEIIAGAAIIGGIAAIASSSNRNRYDRRYRDRSFRQRGNPRFAVEQCVRASEIDARRRGYRYANVVDIRGVRDIRRGWRVQGTVEVDRGRGYGWGNHGRYDRRNNLAVFRCDVRRGRVTDIRYSGLR